MKFCFVILHYRTLNETYQCISYIKGLNNQQDIQIIVVDNGSKDGSLQELKNQIKDKNNILYIESEYNLGFAKGNNLGYTIAKHKYKAEFTIILNSDVYIQQEDFLEKVNQMFQQTRFDILGPDIITKSGQRQNPVGIINDNVNRVNRTILRNRIGFCASFLPLSLKIKFKKITQKRRRDNRQTLNDDRVHIENCPLHGACLIFSKTFIKYHEFPFYPETFLYGEEDILFYLGKKRNEKFVFSSEIKVLHVEDAATDHSFSNHGKKRRFVIKNSNQSLKILKRLMNNQEFN